MSLAVIPQSSPARPTPTSLPAAPSSFAGRAHLSSSFLPTRAVIAPTSNSLQARLPCERRLLGSAQRPHLAPPELRIPHARRPSRLRPRTHRDDRAVPQRQVVVRCAREGPQNS